MYMPEDRAAVLSMGKTDMPACFTALESLAVPEKISRNTKSERTLSVNLLLDVELDEGEKPLSAACCSCLAWATCSSTSFLFKEMILGETSASSPTSQLAADLQEITLWFVLLHFMQQ